jgi:hypothetical protein
MTNLLPQKAKKQIVVEYWVRMVSVWIILWSVTLLVSSIVLWPTYVLIVGSNEAYAESVVDATERTAAYDEIVDKLNRANQQAQAVLVADQAPLLSDIWSTIKQEVGSSVTLDSFTITRDSTGIATVRVSGESPDRQSLAVFRDRLEAVVFITAVDLPIANLAQNQDIEFSLSVEINDDAL